jgi:hypothetical protein
LENSEPFTASTLTYVDSWCDQVSVSGYVPGVYLFSNLAPPMHQHRPSVLLWVTRSWYTGANRPVLDDNLDVGGYCWLTPLGQANAQREPVQMSRPANVPSSGSGSQHWEFVTYPETAGWQHSTDWAGLGESHVLPRWLDNAQRQDFHMITGQIDLDLARRSDPSATAGRVRKTQRRRRVAGVSASSATAAGGATVNVTVQLDKAVADSEDLVVLLRSDLPEFLAPSSVLVPRKQSKAVVTVRIPPMSYSVTATLTARTCHQLRGPFPSTRINLTA